MQEKIIALNEIRSQFVKIGSYFDKDLVEQIAKETEFVVRESKLTGTMFLVIFLVGVDIYEKPTLLELTGLLNILVPGLTVSREALHQRITEKAVNFFEIMLSKLVEIPTQIKLELAEHFEKIIILDSTQIELPKELAELFRGSGGSASKAGMKIQFYYDLKTGRFNYEIQEGVNPDSKYSNNFVDSLNKNDLIIKDLGYFNMEVFTDIADRDAYYLSRWKTSVNLYINEKGDEFDLLKFASSIYETSETEVFIKTKGKMTKARLVLEKVPEKIKNERLRKLNKISKKKGRMTTNRTKILQGYNMYASNIPPDILTKENFRLLYSIRWQIELIFKNWKSNFNLDKLSGVRIERIKCLLYSRLILIFMATKLIYMARNYLWTIHSKELSVFKASKYLKQVFYECLKAMLSPQSDKILFLLLNSIDFLLCRCNKINQKNRAYPLDIISLISLT